jgi:hypothetical protein
MAKKEKCMCGCGKWLSWIALLLVVIEMFFKPSFTFGSFTITALSLAALLLAIITVCASKNCSCDVK